MFLIRLMFHQEERERRGKVESANKPRGEHHSALEPSNHVLKETLLHVITAREREREQNRTEHRERESWFYFISAAF